MWIWRADDSVPRWVSMPPGKGGGMSTAPGLSDGSRTSPGKGGGSKGGGGGTYSTDFSGYATGAQPNDWTKRFGTTGGTWSIAEDAGSLGGKHLTFSASSLDYTRLLSADAVDALSGLDDVEVLCKIRHDAVRDGAFLCVRGSGSDGSENMYRFGWKSSSGIGIEKFVNGTRSDIGISEGFSASDLTWYWLRFRVEGTDLKGRIWADGDAEPGTWLVERTDSDVTGAGWVGLSDANRFNIRDYDYFSVATGGGTAPGP